MNDLGVDVARHLNKLNNIAKAAYNYYMLSPDGTIISKRPLYKSTEAGLCYSTTPPYVHQLTRDLSMLADDLLLVLPVGTYRACDKPSDIEQVYIEDTGDRRQLRVVTSRSDLILNGLETWQVREFEEAGIPKYDIIVAIFIKRQNSDAEREIEQIKITRERLRENEPQVLTDEQLSNLSGSYKSGKGITTVQYHNGVNCTITRRQLPGTTSKSKVSFTITPSISVPETYVAHFICTREHISNHFVFQIMDLEL